MTDRRDLAARMPNRIGASTPASRDEWRSCRASGKTTPTANAKRLARNSAKSLLASLELARPAAMQTCDPRHQCGTMSSPCHHRSQLPADIAPTRRFRPRSRLWTLILDTAAHHDDEQMKYEAGGKSRLFAKLVRRTLLCDALTVRTPLRPGRNAFHTRRRGHLVLTDGRDARGRSAVHCARPPGPARIILGTGEKLDARRFDASTPGRPLLAAYSPVEKAPSKGTRTNRAGHGRKPRKRKFDLEDMPIIAPECSHGAPAAS